MEGLSTWFALLWNKFMVFNDPSSSSLCSHQGQSSTSDRFQAFTSVTVWIVSVLQTNPAFSNLCFVVQALPSEWPYFPLPLALDLKYQQHLHCPSALAASSGKPSLGHLHLALLEPLPYTSLWALMVHLFVYVSISLPKV